MGECKTIKDIDVKGKRVLLRLELNVPLKEGKIKDDTRIDTSLPTIKYLIEKNAKVIILSHLGRPGGKVVPELSFKPVAGALTEKLGKEVKSAPDCIGKGVEEMVNSLREGNVLLLENLRFHPEEEENQEEFVNQLAKLGDVYINDAFGAAHRAHASIVGMPLKFVKEGKDVAVGFLIQKEIETWKPIIESKGKGILIIGGGKLKEKIKAIDKLAKKFDDVIVGGVVSNVFLKAKGYDVGDSLVTEKKDDTDYVAKAKEILQKYNNILLPEKVVIEDKTEAEIRNGVAGHSICDDVVSDRALESIAMAKKVVWFGPMGIYEDGFTAGTEAVKQAINNNTGAHVVIGGGDLASAAAGVKAEISTGGGASITLLNKGTLEGIEALKGNEAYFRK